MEILNYDQDESLDTAREALILRLQALAVSTRPYCAEISTLMSDFPISSEPVAIVIKLEDMIFENTPSSRQRAILGYAI
jgi:hypothetical protein